MIARSSETPALENLVQQSTDIAEVQVLSTNPRKADEGARDTAVLQVIQGLKGLIAANSSIQIYYHMRWLSMMTWQLEPPRFVRGRKYIVFLKQDSKGYGPNPSLMEYNLTDSWLSIVPYQPALAEDVQWITNQQKKQMQEKAQSPRPTSQRPCMITR